MESIDDFEVFADKYFNELETEIDNIISSVDI